VNKFACQRKALAWLAVVIFLIAHRAAAQGPAPESAPPLFPGGGLVSYNSVITTRAVAPAGNISPTARPTLSHEADVTFTWGFRPNFHFAIVVPIITQQFTIANAPTISGTGLGNILAAVKYRFYRRDSERGTTQASFTVGPKLPTGRTNLQDTVGNLLPASLQPASGSTDLFAAANWTYTGLFGYRRLVADEDFHSLLRSQGTQRTRLGSDVESRFWLSYRPYESKNVAREWFIGPELTWMHSQDERIAGTTIPGSGGDSLLAGVTSYVGFRAGMHAWIGADWSVAHSSGAQFMPLRRHISFGVTQQFRMHF